MGGASGSASESQSRTSIPGFQKRQLKDLFARAQTESMNPLEFFPGQTVAGFDPATTQAQELALARGVGGSPLINAAQTQQQGVIEGDFLDPASNPFLRGTFDQASQAVTENFNRAVLPGIESRFARAGQTNSGQLLGARRIATESLADSLGGLASNIFGGNFQAERGRQEAAVRGAPGLAEQDFLDIGAVGAVGAQREAQSQRLIDDLIARFQFAQDEPNLRLSRFSRLLGGPLSESRSGSEASQFGFNIGGALPSLGGG